MISFLKKIITSNPYIFKKLLILRAYLKSLKHREKVKLRAKNKIIPVINNNRVETFFGYYDKSPINKTNEFIAFYLSEYSTKKEPKGNKSILLVIKNTQDDQWIFQEEILAYNWQQGSKLQWIDDYTLIYNNYDHSKGEYFAKSINVSTGEKKRYEIPIYDATSSFALSLDFERLSVMRPDYGYFCKPLDRKIQKTIKNVCITHLELVSGEQKKLVDLESLLTQFPIEKNNVTHKFNHIMISPNEDKFVFLHRYFFENKKYDRLFLFDLKNESLKLLNDHQMISHYSWIDNKTLVGYMNRKEGGNAYYILDTDTLNYKKLNNNLLDSFGDGHPTVKNNFIVTDSYPNQSRQQKLLTYNLNDDTITELGSFYHSVFFHGVCRCDLHPKWSFDGKKIFFESVYSGKRTLYYIDIS